MGCIIGHSHRYYHIDFTIIRFGSIHSLTCLEGFWFVHEDRHLVVHVGHVYLNLLQIYVWNSKNNKGI